MAAPSHKITDFLEVDSIDEALAELDTEFSHWERASGQSTGQLWSVLGKVYELGNKIEANGTAKIDLIKRVNTDPNVELNPRWVAEKKAAHELLLVSLLSLKPETKATKSQWFSAIRAAKKAETPATQADFVSYIEKVGGIEQARRSLSRPAKKRSTLEELVEAGGCDWSSNFDLPEFRAPDQFHDGASLPHGVGLVLVRGDKAGGPVIPFATITDPKLVEKAMLKMLSAADAIDRANAREYEAEAQKLAAGWRKTLKKRYQARKRSQVGETDLAEFDEYVSGQAVEDDELVELARRDPTIIDRIIAGSAYRHLAK